MTAQIIDGQKIAHTFKMEVSAQISDLRARGIPCGLATVALGDDYSSHAYQRRIDRYAMQLGVPHQLVTLPATTTQRDLLDTVHQLNQDAAVSGILILRPLPPQISEAEIFRAISPHKDIESVHPENAGLLALGTPRFVPSTAASVFHLLDSWLDSTGQDRESFYHRSRIVVVGRSNNVGKALVNLAYSRQAAVTSVDEWASREGQLGWYTRQADVLIVAAGVAGLIRAEHVRPGAVVIDVGINPVTSAETGQVRMVGDVAFDEVRARAGAIAPVPGGVGPVTDIWLISNTIAAACHGQA